MASKAKAIAVLTVRSEQRSRIIDWLKDQIKLLRRKDVAKNYRGRLFVLVLTSLSVVMLSGCGSVPADVARGGDHAWQVWEQDKRPTISDVEYNALPEDQKKFYMPQTKEDARLWERAQWDRRVHGNTSPSAPAR